MVECNIRTSGQTRAANTRRKSHSAGAVGHWRSALSFILATGNFSGATWVVST